MFENLTSIPQDLTEARTSHQAYTAVVTDLIDCIDRNYYNAYRWHAYNNLEIIARMMLLINALNAKPEIDRRAVMYYWKKEDHNFDNAVNTAIENPNHYGLMIHENASTHYPEALFSGYRHLEGAEKVLKQTPQHFLKILTNDDSDILFVYTNKELTPEVVYKLNELQLNMFYKKYVNWPDTKLSEIPTKVAKALVNNDVAELKTILNALLTSEEVLKLRMEKLKNVFNFSTDNQIQTMEKDIVYYNSRITELENEIAAYGVQIRETGEKINALKGIDITEEFEQICKYLIKNPYIVEYKPSGESTIDFKYNAPILYFNEACAEKFIENRTYNRYQSAILKIMIDRKFVLYTQCLIRFDTQNFSTSPGVLGSEPYIGHPHIDKYACFGNHRDAIHETAKTRNYIGAIEQISQAVLNMNFYDSCVTSYLLSTLTDRRNDWYTWRDEETGEMLTTDQAIQKGGYYEEIESNE